MQPSDLQPPAHQCSSRTGITPVSIFSNVPSPDFTCLNPNPPSGFVPCRSPQVPQLQTVRLHQPTSTRPRSVEHGVSQSEPNLSLHVKNCSGAFPRVLGLNLRNPDRSQKRAILLGGVPALVAGWGPAGMDAGAMNAKANRLHCQASHRS